MRSWTFVASVASVGAAAIHHAAALEHLAEWRPAGMFMFILGMLQLAWAIGLAGGGRDWLLAGVWLNGATTVVWALSRTTGLPVGPMPWQAEHIHGPDVLATILEIGVVIACLSVLRGASAPSGPIVRAWLAASAAVFIVGSHDPVREHLIALATVLIAVTSMSLVHTIQGRSHVRTTRWSTAGGVRAVARAGSSAL